MENTNQRMLSKKFNILLQTYISNPGLFNLKGRTNTKVTVHEKINQ